MFVRSFGFVWLSMETSDGRSIIFDVVIVNGFIKVYYLLNIEPAIVGEQRE